MRQKINKHTGNKWQLWFAWFPVCVYNEKDNSFYIHLFTWVKRRFVIKPHPLEKKVIGTVEYKA